jgi:RHS repeat-associated protein
VPATEYLYDGPNAIQETQGGVVNPILSGLRVDERFARNDVTGRAHFISDALDSTLALTDATGAVLQRYSYDPYGNIVTNDMTASFINPYQYTWREADGIGLVNNRARYYSPVLGRFISEDPSGFLGRRLNFYSYAGDSPQVYVDRDGRDPILVGIGFVIGGAAGWVQGWMAGDTGATLASDIGAGALAGGLAGLTDGFSLVWGVPARMAIGTGVEAGRQEIMDGCVHDLIGVGLAAGGALLGDASGGAAGGAAGILGKYGSGAFGDVMGGALSAPAAPSTPDR